jgi:hypothetical protein
MSPIAKKRRAIIAAALSGLILASGPAFADDHGKGRDRGHDRGGHGETVHGRFGEHERIVVREYYAGEFRAGHCPPGLAKKHNGCLPPGQARKWRIGHPLPHDVVIQPVPAALVVKIGPPPPGYRYARVANDILMLAAGTSMVIDAIQDLGAR